MKTGKRRGQATVELALGTLVMVTLLAFGIHFAEVNYLAMKVQESSAAALWDMTFYQMHNFTAGQDYAPRLSAINAAQANIQTRYQDFDGLESENNGSSITQVFTQANGFQATCTPNAGLAPFAVPPMLNGVYQDVGGVTCTSTAKLSPFSFPLSFMDSGAGKFFPTKNYAFTGQMNVCSAGRAWGMGPCQGQFAMLLDDWGLAGTNATESFNCLVLPGAGTCQNAAYYNLANQAFTNAGRAQNSAATTLATAAAGSSPIDENAFWMSYAGDDKAYIDAENGGDADTNPWNTSPGSATTGIPPYVNSYNLRQAAGAGVSGGCFLGLSCN